MTIASEDRVLQLLRKRTKVQAICDLTSWPRRNVTRIAARNGYLIDIVNDVPYRPNDNGDAFDETADGTPPDLRSVPSSPPPPRPPSVLERAEASPSTRTQQLGARIEALMDDLARRLEEEAARERAKQEKEAARERAKQEKEAALAALADARARLRALQKPTRKYNISDAERQRRREQLARNKAAAAAKRQQVAS